MKKFLWILALAVFLSACGNEAKKDQDQAKEVSEVSEDKAKDDEKASDEDKKDAEAEKVSDQDSLTEDDYFFSDTSLVTVKDGKLVNVISDVKKLGDDIYAYPVPLSDDVFLFGTNGENTSTLMKIKGKDFEEIYKIEGQDFTPYAKVYDKVYGHFMGDTDLSKFGYINAYGEIDLKTGKTNIFEALKMKEDNGFLQGIGFTDKEILYNKLNMSGDFLEKRYRLDLSQGYDQKPEEVGDVEGFIWLQSVKYDKDGNDFYDILDIDFDDEGKCYINDIECPTEEGTQFISAGPNLILQTFIDPDKDPYLFKMDIINFLTGEFVAKDVESYGYRVFNGKLYYLDKDKKVQVLDNFK
ncbi:hypothetical protein [uncultured Anaerococcus sp.]|uniref:hypothetical protein n=1 Tax=uncultured Anaerococcus sp. TaxID=293428 RepID=UPI0028894673|nr:hypothetical protein [uncultured Anaerococcus sp.]